MRRRLRGMGVSLFAVGILGIIVLAAVFAPWVSPHDPMTQTLSQRLLPPVWDVRGDPSYVLGTDTLGRDVLSRLLHGARSSLVIAAAAVGLSATVGVTLAALSGYFGGWLEHVVMRAVDAQLALPAVLFAIMVNAIFGVSVANLIVVLALTGWANYTRILFGLVRGLRSREFVEAAIAIGCPPTRILLRHVLPNIFPAIAVVTTLQFARTLLLESGLSFLGLGVPDPLPAWGSMLSAGQRVIFTTPYLTAIPGLAVTVTVWSVNLAGDGLRRALDPRTRGYDSV